MGSDFSKFSNNSTQTTISELKSNKMSFNILESLDKMQSSNETINYNVDEIVNTKDDIAGD